MGYPRSKIVHKITVFTSNGTNPTVQTVIGPAGYDTNALKAIEAVNNQFKDGENLKIILLSEQKGATKTEGILKKLLTSETSHLSESSRTIFGDDSIILSRLGLDTHYFTPTPEPGSQTPPKKEAAHRSMSTAYLIAYSRLLVSNAQALPEDKKAMLAKLGWTDERLTAAANLIEAYSSADITQQKAIAAYETHMVSQKELNITLEKWYAKAVHVVKLVIKSLTPQQQIEIKDLLGLK
jgi:hypothetical protein